MSIRKLVINTDYYREYELCVIHNLIESYAYDIILE